MDFDINATMTNSNQVVTPLNTKKRPFSNIQNSSSGYNNDDINTYTTINSNVHNHFYVPSTIIRNKKRLKIV